MKILRAILLAWLVGSGPALAQQTPFSTYVTGLGAAGTLSGTERMFALQVGSSVTITPYQILSKVTGDCTITAPPSIVCTKTNSATFAASATTDTTNAANISSGTLALPRLALTSAFFYVGNGSNNPAGVAMSGDCTLANTGAVTCTKTGGAAFVASATTDATNAANISSGTLSTARYAAVNLAAGNTNGGVVNALPFANMPAGSADTALGYWSSTTLAATAIPNCTTGALQYSTTTHAWTCNVGGGAGSVTSAQIIGAGLTANSGTCTITSAGVCTLTTTAAVKADQVTATSTATAVTPSVQQNHPSAAKAWVSFQGSGTNGAQTINASYNITAVSRSGFGLYSATFSVPFTTVNYVCANTQSTNSGAGTNGWGQIYSQATGTVGFSYVTLGPSGFDPVTGYLICFGTQ